MRIYIVTLFFNLFMCPTMIREVKMYVKIKPVTTNISSLQEMYDLKQYNKLIKTIKDI